jgi:hypothetical protein
LETCRKRRTERCFEEISFRLGFCVTDEREMSLGSEMKEEQNIKGKKKYQEVKIWKRQLHSRNGTK